MPLPRRHYGRPQTEVIPTDWSASHAPVVEKTLTGLCRVLPPSDPRQIVVNADLSVSTDPLAPEHAGPFRMQQQNAQAAVALLGEQFQTTAAIVAGVIVVIGIIAWWVMRRRRKA